MSNTNRTTIDPTPLYLWPLADALEDFPFDVELSPQGRRLAILLAEAQAAGRGTDVLRVLAAWARVLHGELASNTPGRSVLQHAIAAVEALAFRGERSDELELLLREVARGDARNLPEEQAIGLALFALDVLDAEPATPTAAWKHACTLLSALSELCEDAADPVIARCGLHAYELLFPAR